MGCSDYLADGGSSDCIDPCRASDEPPEDVDREDVAGATGGDPRGSDARVQLLHQVREHRGESEHLRGR